MSVRHGFAWLVRARLKALEIEEESVLEAIGASPSWLTDFLAGGDVDWVGAWQLLLALGLDPGRSLEELISFEPRTDLGSETGASSEDEGR